jgi:hypothetical protein
MINDVEGKKLVNVTDLKGYCLIPHIPFGMHSVTVTTGHNSREFGPFDFKKGHSLTQHFVTVPVFGQTGTTTTTETPTVAVDNQ